MELNVNKQEIVRYLGYGKNEPDETVREQIDQCVAELLRASAMKTINRVFPLKHLSTSEILLGETRIESEKLSKHLRNCDKAILFAATLGTAADLLIRRWSVADLSRAVIMQASAAAVIEASCDACQKELSDEAAKEGFYLRSRFSPGYGDFPLSYQKELLSLLDAPKRIGLTVTDSMMLTPTKSVTAVMGLTRERESCNVHKCASCDAVDCPFRQE